MTTTGFEARANKHALALTGLLLIATALGGCPEEAGPTAGTGGAGGAAGVAGVGGMAGTAGAGGVGGTAGAGGVGGTAGAGGTAGTGGAGGTAGTAGAGGTAGTAGSGGMEVMFDTAQCVTDTVADGRTQACAECICGMCGTELANCVADTSPAPNPTVTETSGQVCQMILDCTTAAGCTGDACWCGCDGEGCCSMGTNYANEGPCKDIINKGASMADPTMGTGGPYYPGESDKLAGPGHPVGNSGAVGVCVDSKCASACM